jgi:CheY-like chemotaxis protein
MSQKPTPSFRKVLLADDDTVFAKLVLKALKEEGYTVYHAIDGQMAMEMALRYKPDVMLLDIGMPVLNGLNVFEKLRQLPATSRTPVIFVSGVMSQVVEPLLQAAPRVAYLKKPFDLVDLSSMLNFFSDRYAA